MKITHIKIYGSIITAVAFVCYILHAQNYFHISPDLVTITTSFNICFLTYLYLRLSKNKRWFLILFVLGIITGFYLYFLFNEWSINRICVLLLNSIVLFYYRSFFRPKFLIKPITIAISWTSWIYFFTHRWDSIFYSQQFIFIALLTLPFDISSAHKDSFQTIPRYYGIQTTTFIIRFLSIIYLALGFSLSLKQAIVSLLLTIAINSAISFKLTYSDFNVYLFYDGMIALQQIVMILI